MKRKNRTFFKNVNLKHVVVNRNHQGKKHTKDRPFFKPAENFTFEW